MSRGPPSIVRLSILCIAMSANNEALHEACKNGNLKEAERLLEQVCRAVHVEAFAFAFVRVRACHAHYVHPPHTVCMFGGNEKDEGV